MYVKNVGACVLDCVFAVHKLWRTLTGADELKPSLLYVGGSDPLCCRTESYTELWEGQYSQLVEVIPNGSVARSEIERDEPLEMMLLVRYVESGSALYRRRKHRPQKQQCEEARILHTPVDPSSVWRMMTITCFSKITNYT